MFNIPLHNWLTSGESIRLIHSALSPLNRLTSDELASPLLSQVLEELLAPLLLDLLGLQFL